MGILENRDEWLASFQAGWLAHYQATGERDWKRYNRPKNSVAPAGPGVDLKTSRLVLVSTAGGYLPHEHEAFDGADPLGDYTVRTFPSATPLDALAFAHEHYDHAPINQDPQVLVPLRHLEDLVAEGVIGELAPSVVSIMGYQPVATRLVDETIPVILQAVREQAAQAALLVPA